MKERHTYINIRYGAGIRQDNTLPCNHARERYEVYFEGHKGKEMSLGWDRLGKRSWCVAAGRMLTIYSPRLYWEGAWDLVANYSTWLSL